ncbi:hypothetical protein PIIN_02521 [Serendipita indica DSM 11827]|uniref:Cation-transporting ATPase n=1 Tax=Serendipita indica (strain DSM 11827) TaxID=1109443 RepID=G4TBH4_SERID|nr:hypothetical protein PIIN_02521 [Serendipita indica DSM 11827]
MPPRKSPLEGSVIDPKSRKLTDFWGRRDSDYDAATSGSPLRSASSSIPNAAGSFHAISPSIASGTPSKTFGSSPRPSQSPRKYIPEEDEEEGAGSFGEVMLLSRKRARESTPSRAISLTPGSSLRQASLDMSNRSINERAHSPPKKRRATDTIVLPIIETEETFSSVDWHQPNSQLTSMRTKGTSISSVEEMLSKPPSEGTVPGSDTDGMDISSGNHSDAHMTSASSDSSLMSDEDTSKHASTADISRLEEIRRKAQERFQAKSIRGSVPVQVSSFMDDSDEDEDELEKMVEKVPKKPPKKPQSTRKSDTKSNPEPVDGSSLPISVGKQERQVPRRNPVRTSRANSVQPPESSPARKTRATSVQRTVAPTSKTTKNDKKKSTKGPVINSSTLPPTSMPSSLASLLSDQPRSKQRLSDPARQRLLQSVEHNISDLGGPPGEEAEDEAVKETREVDHSVTQMALGEEEARKIQLLFARDKAAALSSQCGRPFWHQQLAEEGQGMEMTFGPPKLALPEHLALPLVNAAASHDIESLYILICSGFASSLSSKSTGVLPWLFMTGCHPRCPSKLAVACLSAIRIGLAKLPPTTSQSPITFMHIISCITALGPLAESLTPFGASTMDIDPPSTVVRNQVIARIMIVIQCIARHSLPLPDPDKLILLLLLLHLDPFTSEELRRDIASTVDVVLASIQSQGSYPDSLELDVCKVVVRTVGGFTLPEQHQVMHCLFGGQPSGRRFMRWVALGLLLPSRIVNVDWSQYTQPPPLAELATFTDTTLSTNSPFRVWSETDYDDLFYRVELLGAILTDVQQYETCAESLEHILTNLGNIHGRIATASHFGSMSLTRQDVDEDRDYTDGATAQEIQSAIRETPRGRADSQVASSYQPRRSMSSFRGEDDAEGSIFDGPGSVTIPSSVTGLRSARARGFGSRRGSRVYDASPMDPDGRSSINRLSRQNTALSAGTDAIADSDDDGGSPRRDRRVKRRKSTATTENAPEADDEQPRRTSMFGGIASFFGRRESPSRISNASRSRASSINYAESPTEEDDRWGYHSSEEDESSQEDAESTHGSLYPASSRGSHSRPGTPMNAFPGLGRDPFFGDTRIDMDDASTVESIPPSPGPPMYQDVYLSDEDLQLRLVGYRTIRWRKILWEITAVCSLGLLGLLGHWFPELWLRFVAVKCAFAHKDTDLVVVEVLFPYTLLWPYANPMVARIKRHYNLQHSDTTISLFIFQYFSGPIPRKHPTSFVLGWHQGVFGY